MTSPSEPSSRPADWEAFYRDYRKPGYVPGFEITTKLGGGMFGLVFRARRISIGKDYAIKFLQVDDGEVRKAVMSELEQVKWFAQIDHPNLVSIEDRGEVDGIPWLLMAFAGTETLRDKMSAKVPTAEEKDELLRWFLQCCRGLAALHERSLVHFDIKPANVFLKGSVARLGDYGLSKLVTHSRGSLSMGRGTPYYMAPEMLQRRGDHRSDIYSLGVMLYELLCGKVPFTGDSEWEVLKKHETEPPAMPACLTARERAILQRCLQKEPGARFQSVHDLIAAFGAPASAGAAAWTDIGAAAGTNGAANGGGAAAPPPLPGQRPAAADKGGEDPYAGLGRASKEALRHASVIAQKAAAEAGKIAQQAAEKAATMVRGGLAAGKRRGLRRLLVLRRLRERYPDEEEREQWLEAAEAIATEGPPPKPPEPPPPPGRRRRTWIAIPVAMVFGLLFLGTMFFALAPSPVPSPKVAASTSRVSAGPTGPRVKSNATFASFRIPPRYVGLVSTSEPGWVELAQMDPEAGREKMLMHINTLRGALPLSAPERLAVMELPEFRRSSGDKSWSEIERQVDRLSRLPASDPALEARLQGLAPRSLVAAAEQLAKVKWGEPAEVGRARKLHEWLERTTDCRDLTLVLDSAAEGEGLAAANRNLGALWLWFVNEFAHTPRTWQTFRSLMERK